MAYWPPDFNPSFDIENTQDDLDIVNLGIQRIVERTPVDSQLDADHKTVWDYWNGLCNLVDEYFEISAQKQIACGLLQEINIDNMAQGEDDAIIYQISDSTKQYNGGDYYRGSSPNKLNINGVFYPGVLTNSLSGEEISHIGTELYYQVDFDIDNDGFIEDCSPQRAAAQQGEIDSCDAQISKLNEIITEAGYGAQDYAFLQDLINACNTAIGECNTAKANAQAEIDNGSPELSQARIDYINTRKTYLESDGGLIESSDLRNERYVWTDVRCNISYGSLGNIYGNTKTLSRLYQRKSDLENLLSRYESFE